MSIDDKFDEDFSRLKNNATGQVGSLIASLMEEHEDFDMHAIINVVRGSLLDFEAYMDSSPDVCQSCASQDPDLN